MKLSTRCLLVCLSALLWGACASEPPAMSAAFKLTTSAPEPSVVVKWSESLDSINYFTSMPSQYASPAHVGTTDELLVATQDGEVYKFQAANGELRWRVELGNAVSAKSASADGFAFVGDLGGTMRALALHDGTESWKFDAKSSIETDATYHDGRLFFADASDTLYALDALSGEELWRYQRDTPDYFTLKGACKPAVADGEVYCGFADGRLVSLQIDSGELVWEVDLRGGATELTDVDGEVIVDGETLYASSYSGGIYGVDRFSGEILWRVPISSISDVVYYDTMLYVTSALGKVTAIDPFEGSSTWSFKFKDARPSGIVSYGPYLLVGTDLGMYIFDRGSGYPFQRTRGTTGYSADIEFGADRAYVFSDHGTLMAIKLGW